MSKFLLMAVSIIVLVLVGISVTDASPGTGAGDWCSECEFSTGTGCFPKDIERHRYDHDIPDEGDFLEEYFTDCESPNRRCVYISETWNEYCENITIQCEGFGTGELLFYDASEETYILLDDYSDIKCGGTVETCIVT